MIPISISNSKTIEDNEIVARGGSSPPPSSSTTTTTTSTNLIRITLRGSSTQSLALAIKPSTTIATLLRQYCKKISIQDEVRRGNMWLEFDGERLGEEERVGETEIEDETTVEVRERK